RPLPRRTFLQPRLFDGDVLEIVSGPNDVVDGSAAELVVGGLSSVFRDPAGSFPDTTASPESTHQLPAHGGGARGFGAEHDDAGREAGTGRCVEIVPAPGEVTTAGRAGGGMRDTQRVDA